MAAILNKLRGQGVARAQCTDIYRLIAHNLLKDFIVSKNVMVVDDSAVSRMMLKAIINSARPDWGVVEAESAEVALQKSASTPVDFITLDVNMPGIDGLSAAPAIKEQCTSAKIAIISGKVQPEIRARAEALGLIFIPKPITEDKVLRFLK